MQGQYRCKLTMCNEENDRQYADHAISPVRLDFMGWLRSRAQQLDAGTRLVRRNSAPPPSLHSFHDPD